MRSKNMWLGDIHTLIEALCCGGLLKSLCGSDMPDVMKDTDTGLKGVMKESYYILS